jgi:hypothetical protein
MRCCGLYSDDRTHRAARDHSLAAGGQYMLCRADGSQVPMKITLLYAWHGPTGGGRRSASASTHIRNTPYRVVP